MQNNGQKFNPVARKNQDDIVHANIDHSKMADIFK